MKKIRQILSTLSILPVLYFSGCSGGQQTDDSNTPKKLLIDNLCLCDEWSGSFWDLCAAGVRIAEEELGITCEVLGL